MSIRTGLVALPLLILASSESLEARVPPEAPVLIKRSADARLPRDDSDSSILREVAIEVNIDAARSPEERLRLPLFDGTGELELVQTSRRRNLQGDVIWSGRVRGEPESTVLFSASRDILIANISTQPTRSREARHFEIRFLGERRHVLREVDPSALPDERNPFVPETVQREPRATCSTDPANSIDVLVLFTPKAKAKVNGSDAMRLAIELFVEEANLSYSQSDVAQRLRLVGAEEVVYTESNDLRTDLNNLKSGGANMSGAHQARNDVGADLVVLIVEYTKTKTSEIGCGDSFLMENPSNAFESSAFAVVPRICADEKISFTHELGHLMGARHDWPDESQADSPTKPFAFSHGFIHLPTSRANRPAFRTIMAKDSLCKLEGRLCNRILFWSNPDKIHDASGVPMGVEGGEEPANNARTLNSTAKFVANFRCRRN